MTRLLRQQLCQQLNRSGYIVDAAADGAEGEYLGCEFEFAAAVIDLGLPKIDGLELIGRLRRQHKTFPILVLTARGHWQDKVNGLEAGADDYLAKPFEMPELLARLNALIRRSAGFASPVRDNWALSLDTSRQQVTLNEQPLELTALSIGYWNTLCSIQTALCRRMSLPIIYTPKILTATAMSSRFLLVACVKNRATEVDPHGAWSRVVISATQRQRGRCLTLFSVA
ncbi:MAG: hypothetical protein CM15mP120_11980 [Pseudomonadota bacterium]|nr:MAG: hypothetical protein CM15mP120_11980 [Pseudomonadota bacterium]